jgi:hypothetical protein
MEKPLAKPKSIKEGIELNLDIINPLKRSNAFQLINDMVQWIRKGKHPSSTTKSKET